MKFQKRPFKHDPRSKRFSHHKLFGSITSFPSTLNRPLRPVEDQESTTRCTGYSTAVNGGYIHQKRYSPDYQAAKIGLIQNRSVDEYGADPNAAMKSERDYGFLGIEYADRTLQKDGIEGSGWKAWSSSLDLYAIDNRVAGFVRVDGPQDVFDNIRSALLQAYDPKTGKGATVQAFGRWYHEWTGAEIIPTKYRSFAGYHAYLFIDWVTIDGVPFLKAQNSYGSSAGKDGFHLFPREVVNKEFGGWGWGVSLKIAKALTLAQMAEAKKETDLGKLWRGILACWYLISEKFGFFGGTYTYDLLTRLRDLLLQLFIALQTHPPRPQPEDPPVPLPEPPKPSTALLGTFCDAISEYEGGPKDRNHRNNNPGNIKYGPFAISCGATGHDDKNFAIFASWDAGMKALQKLVSNAARGISVSYKPTMNFYQFFSVYAPNSDGNFPIRYAEYVARRCEVDAGNFLIKNLI